MTKATLEQIDAKWTQLTAGLNEATAPRCAWAMESVVTSMKTLSEDRRADKFGTGLKFVFPTIRRTMDLLGEGTEFHQVHAAASRAVQECSEAAGEIDHSDHLPVEFQTKLAATLADEIHTALLTFPS